MERHLSNFWLALLLTAVMLLMAPLTLAATLCVNPGGTSGCYASIQSAIDAANPRDTISIAPGIYAESLSINKDLKLQGAGIAQTILDGEWSHQVIIVGQYGAYPNPYVDLRGMTIQHGNTSGFGGAVLNYGNLFLMNAEIRSNMAYAGGGIENLGTLALNTVTVSDNSASGYGGGIDNNGQMTLLDVMLSTNWVSSGTGGGIDNSSGAILNRVTLHSNFAISGGGIANWGAGNLIINNSSIAYNTSTYAGGGIANAGTLQMTNSTVSTNWASMFYPAFGGGGIENIGNAMLTNVTIAHNETNSGGGGIWHGNGVDPGAPITTTLKNAIIAQNVPANCGSFWWMSVVTSAGFNLSNDSSCGLAGQNDMNNRDPRLGVLETSGGNVLIHPLLPDSPAIDGGTNAGCPATDQRGLRRPFGSSCDIGAFEYSMYIYALPIIHR
jgi:hypothetical protein